MKKFTALILAVVLVLSLAACGTTGNNDTAADNTRESAAPEASAAPTGKALVVYFQHRATPSAWQMP